MWMKPNPLSVAYKAKEHLALPESYHSVSCFFALWLSGPLSLPLRPCISSQLKPFASDILLPPTLALHAHTPLYLTPHLST